MKKNFGFEFHFLCEWCHKWGRFLAILAHVTWPRAQPLDRSISLKLSLESRLESKSFERLIDFLAFLVQMLWSKINKLIKYLILGLINCLILKIITFVPETSAIHPSIKDAFSLVSNKNFEAKYYHLAVWALGQMKWAKVS